MMMWGSGFGMPGFGRIVFFGLFNLVFIIIIGALGFLVFKAIFKSNEPNRVGGQADYNLPQDALSILKERYARGEISREEYLSIREDIKQDDHKYENGSYNNLKHDELKQDDPKA